MWLSMKNKTVSLPIFCHCMSLQLSPSSPSLCVRKFHNKLYLYLKYTQTHTNTHRNRHDTNSYSENAGKFQLLPYIWEWNKFRLLLLTINDDNIIIINVNMNNVMKQLKSDNHCVSVISENTHTTQFEDGYSYNNNIKL